MTEQRQDILFSVIVCFLSLSLPLCLMIGLGHAGSSPFSDLADRVEQSLPVSVHVRKIGVCQGSGCIISPDGIVFTAKHVTDGEYGEYEVTLNDGRVFPVKAVVESKNHDVAFLQLDLPDGVVLPYAKLADLSRMRVGEAIYIIGSPYGSDQFNTVSLGILSAMQRNLDAKRNYGYGWTVTFQSTSPAAPGNSGGPVFDMQGNVVGVLVAGMEATLNFSVPVAVFMDKLDVVRRMFEELEFKVVEKQGRQSTSYYTPGGSYR